MKRSRRYNKITEEIDKKKYYILDEGVSKLKESSTAKFEESVEISVNLGVDPKHSDQLVRGIVSLPHGTGRNVKVLVLNRGDKDEEAKQAGADYVGFEDYIKKIEEGWLDFDVIIASPDVMSSVGKLGKILGRRGLMPNPKSGTVTKDIERTVKEVKAGKIEFRVDKYGILHTSVGKLSFDKEKLIDNILTFISAVIKLKPPAAKGQYIKRIVLSNSMGPGIKIDHLELLTRLK